MRHKRTRRCSIGGVFHLLPGILICPCGVVAGVGGFSSLGISGMELLPVD